MLKSLSLYDYNRITAQFRTLREALIDASSLIYLSGLNLLERVSDEVNLFTLPEMLAEARIDDKITATINSPGGAMSNDQKLIACAKKHRLPVISDDKSILLSMKRYRLPYFNSLMMINFLYYRKRISASESKHYFRQLEHIAWYGDDVWQYGLQLFSRLKRQEDKSYEPIF